MIKVSNFREMKLVSFQENDREKIIKKQFK